MLPFALSPLTWRLLRIGAVAAVAVYASRNGAPKNAGHEQVLDDLPEGLATHTRRVLRLGPQGPAVEIEAAGLGRVRLRRAG